MSETLGKHKAPIQKINNPFEVSHPDWGPELTDKNAQKNKHIHFCTCVS